MLKSNVFDNLSFSESCIYPLTIVSTYLLRQGDSYSGFKPEGQFFWGFR